MQFWYRSAHFRTVWKSQHAEFPIQSGKPAQNAYIERFNRTFREDVLDAYLFESINQVNALAYEWQIDYNSNHPHKALNGLSPWLYAKEALVS
ncbi:integrase core domain-containing protein [Sphingobacterium daejeonense]|uniref:integrase core domain-containing protein n=1 Tax=Sphingobacterium daejeonense TaxID=371142 RepID=UPI003D310CAE